MARRISLDDFARRCSGCSEINELWKTVTDFYRGRGMVRMSFHSNDPKRPGSPPLGIQAVGFPAGWREKYIAGGLWQVDPITEVARRLGRPFWWGDIRTMTKLTPQNLEFLEIAAGYGLGQGLAIPVFGPNMFDAFVGVGFGDERPDLLPTAIFEMQCAAQISHLRYCEVTGKSDRLSQNLSPRELEVLRWIARGKSNTVIAEILGISKHTVDSMLRRLFEKLEAHDRTTAVLKAVRLGLLYVNGKEVS